MSTFKIGDHVELIGAACDGKKWVAETYGLVSGTAPDGIVSIQFLGYGPHVRFPANSLRKTDILAGFAVGDRVRVKATGEEDRIVVVWHADNMPRTYELPTSRTTYFSDELEIAPKREPKAGEVWQKDDMVLLRTPEQIPAWVVLNGPGRGALRTFRKPPLTFLAESPADYFKGLL